MSPSIIELQCHDGAKNALTLYENSDDAAPVFLILPAMAVPAGKYQTLAECLLQNNMSAATLDLRGVGLSSVRASRQCDFSYQTLLDQDIDCAIKRIKQVLPKAPLYLLGHSLGGQLSVLYSGLNHDKLSGIVLAASCSVYYAGWRFPRSIGLLLLSQLAAIIAQLYGHFPGHSLGFGGREARSLMRDWANNARTGDYTLKNSQHQYNELLAKVDCPVLAVNFTEDQFAPVKATEQLLAKLTKARITRHRLSGHDLGIKTANHFNWPKYPQALVRIIRESLIKPR